MPYPELVRLPNAGHFELCCENSKKLVPSPITHVLLTAAACSLCGKQKIKYSHTKVLAHNIK